MLTIQLVFLFLGVVDDLPDDSLGGLQVGVGDAFKRLGYVFLGQRYQCRLNGAPCGSEINEVGPPVLRIVAPLHQALAFEPADQLKRRDLTPVEAVGEILLRQAIFLPQVGQDCPLFGSDLISSIHETRLQGLAQKLGAGGHQP